MKRAVALFAVTAGLLLAPSSQAQVRVELQLPSVRFEVPPPLVVVTPGVQVVPDYDEEVFFHSGWYWTRHHDHWYRARDHRGGWVLVHDAHIPMPVRQLPPGHYRRYRAGPRSRFQAPPPVVYVQPGVQVVREHDEEVFLHNGWYWVRQDGGWYRARDYRGGWRPVEARYVPRTLNSLPPGQYRHYREPPREDHSFGRDQRPGGDLREHREERGRGKDRDHDRGPKRDDHRGHGRH